MKAAGIFCFAVFSAAALHCQEDRPGLLFSDTSAFHFTRLEINSCASDFGVTSYGNGFVFASSRTSHSAVHYSSGDSLAPLLDLFYMEKSASGKYSKPHSFSGALNTKYNEGPASFSHDGNSMICTRNVIGRNAGDEPLLGLYSSSRKNGKWQTPVILPFCKPQYNYSHPSLSANDSLLFFSSDCPGGYGGTDIYYSRLTANGWSTPVNAGPKINSSADEVFPFCSALGNLYFSSNRSGGKGKLDIYVCNLADTLFMRPLALGGPINSPYDDFGFWCSADETEGYFSSNRNGSSADDDIYSFRIDLPVKFAQFDTITHPDLCYTFFEEASLRSADTAGMTYEWAFGDGTKKKGLKVHKCFKEIGTYSVALNILDRSTGDLVESEVSYELDIENPNPLEVLGPDTIAVNKPVTLDAGMAELKGYTIKAVYFDFGNGYRKKGISASHVYHRKGVYYARALFRLKNESTGEEESRCVVKKITVL